MKTHKEGRTIILVFFIVYAAVTTGLFFWLPWLGYVSLVVGAIKAIFVVRFFRVPQRVMPELSDKVVYSPCDGTVVAIEEVVEDEYLKEKVLKIAIFMSVNNVHVNWFPVGGVVKYFKYHPGKYLVAWAEKSSEVNERTTTVVETSKGHEILFRQIAGFLARRIVNRTTVGTEVAQCSECGFIKFGSRMDIYMPLGSEAMVSVGEKVTGTQTVIAHTPVQ